MTYEQYCANYKPGRYERVTDATAIQRDADMLQRLLACVLWRLDEHRRAS